MVPRQPRVGQKNQKRRVLDVLRAVLHQPNGPWILVGFWTRDRMRLSLLNPDRNLKWIHFASSHHRQLRDAGPGLGGVPEAAALCFAPDPERGGPQRLRFGGPGS